MIKTDEKSKDGQSWGILILIWRFRREQHKLWDSNTLNLCKNWIPSFCPFWPVSKNGHADISFIIFCIPKDKIGQNSSAVKRSFHLGSKRKKINSNRKENCEMKKKMTVLVFAFHFASSFSSKKIIQIRIFRERANNVRIWNSYEDLELNFKLRDLKVQDRSIVVRERTVN